MKIYIYVEGPSDIKALNALWENWRSQLRLSGIGIKINHLDDKSKFLRKIGHRAAEKLAANEIDLVIGMPDLYPNKNFKNTIYKHENIEELKEVQTRLVKKSLQKDFQINNNKRLDSCLERFYPCCLKHDLEMLLLASVDELRNNLGTKENLGNWTIPVENQNQNKPPKRIIENLFRTKKKKAYRDTKDAPAILREVDDLSKIIFYKDSQINCPVFKEMLDWVEDKTGSSAYK